MNRFQKHYERLKHDLSIGAVDKLVVDILLSLNTGEKLYTSSSCSGRVSFICTSKGKEFKQKARLCSIHGLTSLAKLLEKMVHSVTKCKFTLIMRVRGFILDISIGEDSLLQFIHRIFSRLGFKGVYVKSISKRNHIIEYISPVKLDVPVVVDGLPMIDLKDKDRISKFGEFLLAYLYRNIIEVNIYRLGIWYMFQGNDDATLK